MIIINVGPVEADTLLHRLYVLPFGRASVLFVVIAGLGMGWFLRGRTGPALFSGLAWRVLVLALLGLVLQTLTSTVSVILTSYALLFLLAPLLWRLPTRWLVGVGLAMMVVGPALIVGQDATAAPRAQAGPTLTTPPGEALHALLLSGPYPLLSWVVPFIAGLLLARTDLTDRRVLHRMTVWGGVAAVVAFALADLAYALLGPVADRGWARMLTGVAHGQMPLWLISATGGAAFVIAVCIRLGRRGGPVIRGLAASGQLALSIYVAHVLVLAVVKPEDGFSFPAGVATSVLLVAVMAPAAVLWQRTGRPGPLERLLRTPWLRRPPTRAHASDHSPPTQEDVR
jgi:uncharacterized membrane protein YeiB